MVLIDAIGTSVPRTELFDGMYIFTADSSEGGDAWTRKARSVVQKDCYTFGVLSRGYKLAILEAQAIEELGIDKTVYKKQAQARMDQLCEIFKQPLFNFELEADISRCRSFIGSLFDRLKKHDHSSDSY